MNTNKEYNLNIQSYSLDELMQLFNLNTSNLSVESLKEAKKKVLMMHPDKSKLDTEYYLFYVSALQIIVNHFKEMNKVNQTITAENTTYKSNEKTDFQTNIQNKIGKMDIKDFNSWFNKQFEDNMIQKKDTSHLDWFKEIEPDPQYDIKNTKEMSKAFEKIKEKNTGLIKYNGVENIMYQGGTTIYDEDNSSYISSDPFGKLKFEDLRKVHKDQPVFAVSENDYKNVKKYTSVDHLIRERGMNSKEYQPMEKTTCEDYLKEQENKRHELYLKQKHISNLRTLNYEEKNKSIISTFLNLTN